MIRRQVGARLLSNPSRYGGYGYGHAFGYATTASTKGEPFVLPRVVIDLDASDSKYVRQWDEMDPNHGLWHDGSHNDTSTPARKAAKRALVKSKNLEAVKTEFWPSKTSRAILNTVMPTDMLAYTLLGHPHKTPLEDGLYRLFKEHDILREDSTPAKFQKMLDASSPTPHSEDFAATSHAISSCGDWTSLCRMISVLSSTVQGCELLVKHGRSIVGSIILCRKIGKTHRRDVLILLNNLLLNMTSKGIPIGAYLCNAGMYYAAKCHNIAAIKRYLEISRGNQYATNLHTGNAAIILFRTSVSSYYRDLPQAEIWSLLTGRRSDSTSYSSEEQIPSFADLLSQPQEAHSPPYFPQHAVGFCSRYLTGLGHIGWARTIEDLWLRSDLPNLTESPDIRSKAFVVAFLLVEDTEGALAALEAGLPGSRGSFVREFQAHYWLHSLRYSKTLFAEMDQSIPHDPTKALNAISRLLITDIPRFGTTPGAKTYVAGRLADWGCVNGQEGLLIKNSLGDDMYFKPQGQLTEL